jgi:hypothetical protein
MMMMPLYHEGVPFRDVYLHALVRDEHGDKMSKSKGNSIDPLEMVDKFGADAFRFTLAAFTAQGRDVRMSEERIQGYKFFVNKLWNAARFSLMNLEDAPAGEQRRNRPPVAGGRWIQARLNGPWPVTRPSTNTGSTRRRRRYTSSSGMTLRLVSRDGQAGALRKGCPESGMRPRETSAVPEGHAAAYHPSSLCDGRDLGGPRGKVAPSW